MQEMRSALLIATDTVGSAWRRTIMQQMETSVFIWSNSVESSLFHIHNRICWSVRSSCATSPPQEVPEEC